MKTIDFNTILAVVAAVGTLGGIFAWWLSKFLEDRMSSLKNKMEIDFIKQRLDKIDEDIEEIQEWYNKGRMN